MPVPADIENERLLELFFSQSLEGFFFMMLDEPVEWGDHVRKEEVLDYVFEHQRMTKVNAAILTQFNVSTAEELLGRTPAEFFAHDLAAARERWRDFFDRGHVHTETDERRLDGRPMRIEGDYMVIYDDQRRIAGHFGIQRDITDQYLAAEQLRSATDQLRALATRLQRVREEERTSIAREIHDELGQALTGLKLDVSWMKRGRPPGDPVSAQCAAVIHQIDQTMSSVRRIATALRPSVLDQLGVAAALEWQGQEFSTRTGIAVATDLAVDDAVRIPDDLGSSVFRILQEALTNVARHARASRVEIGFTVTPALLAVTITDDGIGLPPAPLEGTASLGIVGMRERALASGGEFSIAPAPGGGTRVSLRVPLPSAAA